MKYSEETVARIIEAIESGLSNEKAADYGGVRPKTFYEWLKEYEDFAKKVTLARAVKCKTLIEAIKAAGLGMIEVQCPHCQKKHEVKIPKAQWQAIAWVAERTERKEFGAQSKVELTGPDGEPLITEVVFNYHKSKEE